MFVLDAPPPATADYVGSYADGPKHKIEIAVNADGSLVAFIDDAQYPLKITGTDELTNGGGGKVPFHRGSDGRVDGYTDGGAFHKKLSADVSPETLALAIARPRPAGEVYSYHRPADLHDGIDPGDIARTPLGAGTADAIVAAIADGTYRNVHSVLLYLDGQLVMEEYFYGYDVMRQQQLRSATKSVVAATAGIAIDRGALTLDTPVTTRLSYTAYDHPDPRKARITVRDVLTMSSGLDCNDHSDTSPGRETVLDDRPDWVKATLDLPQINDPGKVGYYCSGGVAVVGRVIENATHSYLPDYADAHLFQPMGIKRKDWTWNYDLTNNDKEFSQIRLRPRDMLKLGIVYADGGRWHGKRVLSRAWVEASRTVQSTVDDSGYGYFWWRPWLNVDGKHVEFSAAQGNGGQKIYILPQYRLVAVFTGGDYNTNGSPPNKIMARLILPKLIAAHPNASYHP